MGQLAERPVVVDPGLDGGRPGAEVEVVGGFSERGVEADRFLILQVSHVVEAASADNADSGLFHLYLLVSAGRAGK